MFIIGYIFLISEKGIVITNRDKEVCSTFRGSFDMGIVTFKNGLCEKVPSGIVMEINIGDKYEKQKFSFNYFINGEKHSGFPSGLLHCLLCAFPLILIVSFVAILRLIINLAKWKYQLHKEKTQLS